MPSDPLANQLMLLFSACLWCLVRPVGESRLLIMCCWVVVLHVQFVSEVRIQFYCCKLACHLAEREQVKVVAIDTGAGLVLLNPEEGGVVVATARSGINVQLDEDLLVYQSTKQIRVAGSGFEHVTEASGVVLLPMVVEA